MTDPDRRLSERLHGIADHSMAVTIGNMVQEMITELQKRESPGYPGHISFTIADAEREAITGGIYLCEGEAGEANENVNANAWAKTAGVLRGLLERLR